MKEIIKEYISYFFGYDITKINPELIYILKQDGIKILHI